jgi:hypothetical protein
VLQGRLPYKCQRSEPEFFPAPKVAAIVPSNPVGVNVKEFSRGLRFVRSDGTQNASLRLPPRIRSELRQNRPGSSSGRPRSARRSPLPRDDKSEAALASARNMTSDGNSLRSRVLCNRGRGPSTTRDGSRGSPARSAQDDSLELQSSNMGTWRWSSVGPRLGRREAPITAKTVSDSRAVRGTKMRWVLERWSGGFTR